VRQTVAVAKLVSSVVKTSYDKRNPRSGRGRRVARLGGASRSRAQPQPKYDISIMPKIHFTIPYPAFIERLAVAIVLHHRKKHYGFTFRRIKLVKSDLADAKHRYAIVDPEDYQKIVQDDWQLYDNHNSKYYAVRIEDCKIVFMHRQIMGNPVGKVIDHRNREGLDNRKSNLRLATRSQNNCNRGRLKNGSSKYRGVSRSKKRRKWRAGINYNGIYKHLGFFENEEDTARAYDEAAKIYHGEFATLNFPQVAAGK